LEDTNPDAFLAAPADVAKAFGMAQIARDAGLGRESLYQAFSSVASLQRSRAPPRLGSSICNSLQPYVLRFEALTCILRSHANPTAEVQG
jgi:hypothetical protein